MAAVELDGRGGRRTEEDIDRRGSDCGPRGNADWGRSGRMSIQSGPQRPCPLLAFTPSPLTDL